MEYLARTLQKYYDSSDNDIGIRLTPSDTPIPFLCFADDTPILANASLENAHLIKQILDKIL